MTRRPMDSGQVGPRPQAARARITYLGIATGWPSVTEHPIVQPLPTVAEGTANSDVPLLPAGVPGIHVQTPPLVSL
jgi:hypothetical protein